MEKRAETSQHSSRSGRVKREPSPSAKERKTKAPKSVKLQEPHKRKEKPEVTEEEEERGEANEAQIISSSTVVNVDSVRERIKEDREELLGLLETEGSGEGKYLGVCELLLIILVLSVVIFFFPIAIWFCVKIVREHERAMKFRLGHLLQKRPRGPGLMFYFPFLDVCHIVDIRLKILKIPPHTVISLSCIFITQTVLQSFCLLKVSLQTGLKQYVSLDSVTCRWGIKVERAEIEEISLPPELQHNFAVEAEARRQAQVKVIAAEGEKAACGALKASVESLSGSPMVVHLRLLQLLNNLRSEQPAVILNIPPDVLTQSIDLTSLTRPANQSLTTGDGSDDANKDSPMM
uniref:Podocin-like n=1 Tax=Sinocyclocheilus grahami TaxID=75366 RepID=A0A672NW94_SINGR